MTLEPNISRTHVAVFALLLALLSALNSAAANSASGRASFDRMIVIDAKPGRDTVSSVAIDWCSLVTLEHASGGALARKLTQMEERGWHWNHIPQVATLLCGGPTDPDYKKQAAYFVQGLVNLTGQSQKVVIADLKARLSTKTWERQRAATCEALAVGDEASQREKDVARALEQTYGCGRDPEPAWWVKRASVRIADYLDRDISEPSQVLRAYHVQNCLAATGDAHQVVAYAMCSADIDALDEATLRRELKAAGANGYAKTVAHQHLRHAILLGAERAALVRKRAAKSDAIAKFALATPKAALKAWNKAWFSNQEALSAAADYEALFFGPSRAAAKNCSTMLRKHFRKHVKAAKPSSFEAVSNAATDTVGALLISRLAACEAIEGNAHAAAMLYKVAAAGRVAGGPRAAILSGLIDALNEIRADRPRFPIGFDALPRPSADALLDQTYRLSAKGITAMQKNSGSVKRTKKAGDGLIVEFATVSWIEDNWHCKDTKQVHKIESSGRVIYHKRCKKVGKRTVKKTPKTIWVPSSYAAGIRKGAFLEFDYDVRKREGKSIGSVRTVYKSKKRKRLVAALGVSL